MTFSSYEKKIIASLIRNAENEVINQAIKENRLSLNINARQYTPTKLTACSCMCISCGTGPLAPGANGKTDYCASCRK